MLLTLRLLPGVRYKQHCATNSHRHMKVRISSMMLISQKMTNSRCWGGEDYCTPGVKIIKKVEICHRSILGRQDFKRGVFAWLNNGDRTMDLKWY
jgi:hypothetical protein